MTKLSKKMRWIIGATTSILVMTPIVATSLVACSSNPSLNQQVSNQQIANSIQNYFHQNSKLLNGTASPNQTNNLFLSSMYYLNWSSILSYLKSVLQAKPYLKINNVAYKNYNLNALGVQPLKTSDYNYTDGTITFTLTYNGIPAQNTLTLTNLQTLKPTQNPSIQINTQPQNVQAGNGLPAQISVNATGLYNPLASLSYQWYFQKNNSATPVALKNDTTYSGVNTATLNIASTNTQTIGAYYVVISFPFANSLTSASANLTLINNPSTQISNVFHASVSGKQEVAPTLSSNVANAVNGINGSDQYVGPDGKINPQGIDQIKKAIQKTLASNPSTAGYQNLPIKINVSNVDTNNQINITYQVGNIKGQIDNVNVGLNQTQASEKLTEWLNNPVNLQKSLGEYFKANPNQILQTINGRYTTGNYQWLSGQTPDVQIVPNSLKVFQVNPVIWASTNLDGTNGEWIQVNKNIIKEWQIWVDSLTNSEYNTFQYLIKSNSPAVYEPYNALEVSLKTTSVGYMFQTISSDTSNQPPNNTKAFEVPIGTKINLLLPFTGNASGEFLVSSAAFPIRFNLQTINAVFTRSPENNPETKISWQSYYYGQVKRPNTNQKVIFRWSNSAYNSSFAPYYFKYQGKYIYPATMGYYGPYANGNAFEMQSPTENHFTQGIISSNAFKAQANSIQSSPMTTYNGLFLWPTNNITGIIIPGLPWYYTNK